MPDGPAAITLHSTVRGVWVGLCVAIVPLGCAVAGTPATAPAAAPAAAQGVRPDRGSWLITYWRNPSTGRVVPKDPTFSCPGMPGPPLPAPPHLRGRLIGVSRQFRLVVVDLDGASGIAPGHRLALRRNGRQLGHVRVDRVFLDRAVCTPERDVPSGTRGLPSLLDAVAVPVPE